MRLTTLITIYPLRLTAKSMLLPNLKQILLVGSPMRHVSLVTTNNYIFCKVYYFASIACVILIVADALLADALFPNRPQAISSHHANSVMLGSTNEIRRYIVTSSLIGCAYSHNGFFFYPFSFTDRIYNFWMADGNHRDDPDTSLINHNSLTGRFSPKQDQDGLYMIQLQVSETWQTYCVCETILGHNGHFGNQILHNFILNQALHVRIFHITSTKWQCLTTFLSNPYLTL